MQISDLDPATRRRLAARAAVRSFLVAAATLVAYGLIPVGDMSSARVVSRLVLCLAGFVLVVGWQIRSILVSRNPQIRALETLTSAVVTLIVIFAYCYTQLSTSSPTSFSEQIDKVDALYFATTVLATVGFGDIAARSDLARVIVTLQMVSDVVLVGLVVKLIFAAASRGTERRAAEV